MALPTRWKLASALVAAGLYDMADRAVAGWYDDFLSPSPAPIMQLVSDLQKVGTPEAQVIAKQAMNGDFDGTEEEGATWAKSPEGREALSGIIKKGGPI